MYSKRLKQSGMGLVEVMVAAAMLGGLSLVVMRLSENSQKSVVRMEKGAEAVEMDGEINSILARKADCTETMNSLGGVTIASITGTNRFPATGSSLIIKTAPVGGNPAVEVYTAGDKRGLLTFVEAYIIGYTELGTPTRPPGTANLIKKYTFLLSPNVTSTKTKSTLISITPSADSTNADACILRAAESDSVWKVADYGIFYEDNTVSIGKPSDPDGLLPLALDVKGQTVIGFGNIINYIDPPVPVDQTNAIFGGLNNIIQGSSTTQGTIVGGTSNQIVSGENSVILGGEENTAIGIGSAVIGGGGSSKGNRAEALNSVIIGGNTNRILSTANDSIVSGFNNTASGNYSALVGGRQNKASEEYAAIAGGQGSSAKGSKSFIGGGRNNTASGISSAVIAGGGAGASRNVASGDYSVILGGAANLAEDAYSAVLGGSGSKSIGKYSSSGGRNNRAGGTSSSAIGGGFNTANGSHATIGGGSDNVASAPSSSVIGGFGNTASSASGYTIAGGHSSRATGDYSVALGNRNSASGDSSFSTGKECVAEGNTSSVIGGYKSRAKGPSSIAGGHNNTASGDYAVALGTNSTASGGYAMAIGKAKATHHSSMVFGDVRDAHATSSDLNEFTVRFTNQRFCQDPGCTVGQKLNAGGWANITSSRKTKEDFKNIDEEEVLEKMSLLDIPSWVYKNQENKSVRSIGAMAEDFQALFGKPYSLASQGKSIGQNDINGVALVSIKALEKRTSDLQKKNDALNERLVMMQSQMDEILRRLDK